MKTPLILFASVASICLTATALGAEESKNLQKAKNVVDAVRLPDPPKESTGTAKPSAAEIAKSENAKEQQRQREESRKHSPDHINVPPPTSSTDTAKGKTPPSSPPAASSDTAKGKSPSK